MKRHAEFFNTKYIEARLFNIRRLRTIYLFSQSKQKKEMRAPYTGTGIESGRDSQDEYEIDNQEGGKDSELWIRSFS
jgi:hypothetical protein